MSRGEPAALRYLRRAGVALTDIQLVVATHWDNDHVVGLPQIFEQAPSARFFYPNVVDRDRLARLVATAEVAGRDGRSRGAEAFGRVADVLSSRGDAPRPVGSGTILYRDDSVTLLTLSPTAAAVQAGLAAVGAVLASEPDAATAAEVVEPNFTSLVVWVESPGHTALLGADLEKHEAYGWPAAIDETATLSFPQKRRFLRCPTTEARMQIRRERGAISSSPRLTPPLRHLDGSVRSKPTSIGCATTERAYT